MGCDSPACLYSEKGSQTRTLIVGRYSALYQASSPSYCCRIKGIKTLNPKTKHQLAEEAMMVRFLQGRMILLQLKCFMDIIINQFDERRVLMANLMAILVVCFSIMSAPLGWAHGGNQHVMGTVIAIDPNHIEVKTPTGETISVQLSDKTTYHSKNTPQVSSRPRIGDRVVIEAGKEGAGLKALEMEYSAVSGRSGAAK